MIWVGCYILIVWPHVLAQRGQCLHRSVSVRIRSQEVSFWISRDSWAFIYLSLSCLRSRSPSVLTRNELVDELNYSFPLSRKSNTPRLQSNIYIKSFRTTGCRTKSSNNLIGSGPGRSLKPGVLSCPLIYWEACEKSRNYGEPWKGLDFGWDRILSILELFSKLGISTLAVTARHRMFRSKLDMISKQWQHLFNAQANKISQSTTYCTIDMLH